MNPLKYFRFSFDTPSC